MPEEPTLDQLKLKLLELINSSEALKTISDEERSKRIDLMMEGSKEDILGYIQVFEEEKLNIQHINKELSEHSGEIQEAVVKEKYDKIQIERQKELAKENQTKINDDKKAENLINELGKTEKSEVKTIEKPKKSKKSIVKEIIAALLGMIFTGLAGVLIVYLMILPMDVYKRLDVAFSIKPLVLFPAYWVAVIFSALLGLIMVPFLRLLKTKSFALSILLSAILGGIIVGLARIATGLNYDIIIMQDVNPIGFRGYWIAVVFSVLIGFFAQIINRIINRFPLFNQES